MVKLNELRKRKVEDESYICAQCGYCSPICPIYEQIGWESTSPRGKIYFLKRLTSKGLLGPKADFSPEFVDRIFQCCMCGYCKEVCQTSIDLPELWQATRTELFKRNLWPQPLKQLASTLESTPNIYARPPERTWAMMTNEAIKQRIKKRAEIAYFTGCVFAYSRRFASIPNSFALVMDKLGLDYTILGPDEWCCGSPLFLSGGAELAERLVRHNVESIKELGVGKVILTCAGCYRAFKKEYPRILHGDLPFEVLHSSELLAQLLDEGKLKFKGKVKKAVTYHDPCELGRFCQVYEEPRKILENIPGLDYTEMLQTKSRCVCCGGGGLLKTTNPELALKIALNKLDEAENVGANTIVSGCAACKLNISDAITKSKAKSEVLDIVEIVANALGVK